VDGKACRALTTTNGIPRRDSHAEMARHRNDLTLHVAEYDIPATLVDAELRLAGSTSVGVGRRDDVCGCVADAQVQHFALFNNSIKRVHDLLNASGPVPPVDIQDVDPVGLELLQRVAKRDVERTLVVAGGIERAETLALLIADVVGGEFCSDDHLVSAVGDHKSARWAGPASNHTLHTYLLPRSFIHSPIQSSDSSSW
jgi:hypothetical protein